MSTAKYLDKVYLNSDVHAICLQHAFTTEKHEVMGLLIGYVDEDKRSSHISACVILNRSCKQADRVEISPEQLCEASTYAEELTRKLDRPMRVVGWYHSHPHITVWPSHVDIRTQGLYQTMDPFFVGLIYSVFQHDAKIREQNRIELTCFQSSEGNRVEVPLLIKPSPLENYNLEAIAKLPSILMQEESRTSDGSKGVLAEIHQEASKTLAMVQILSKVSIPLCEILENRLVATKLRIEELKRLKASLHKNLN